jgi:hypothetical protein
VRRRCEDLGGVVDRAARTSSPCVMSKSLKMSILGVLFHWQRGHGRASHTSVSRRAFALIGSALASTSSTVVTSVRRVRSKSKHIARAAKTRRAASFIFALGSGGPDEAAPWRARSQDIHTRTGYISTESRTGEDEHLELAMYLTSQSGGFCRWRIQSKPMGKMPISCISI